MAISSVAGAVSSSHDTQDMRVAVASLLENLDPPLNSLVKPGDRVFAKVNMGCSQLREPGQRFTTHPAFAEAVIRALLDCGAHVTFGDDVSRAGRHTGKIWDSTGFSEVAERTGARLVDLMASGGREVRGNLLYPRSYLVSNAYLDADRVVNIANFRSHASIMISGAIKNMFGVVLGLRKALIHKLFRGDPRKFSRAIADIHRTVRADISFLDLTSVVEGHGLVERIRPVGHILASTDPVALDTLGALAVGYHRFPIWTTRYAKEFGLGCGRLEDIRLRGLDLDSLGGIDLAPPLAIQNPKPGLYDWASNLANATLLRSRPVVTESLCTACGECSSRCPVQCISTDAAGKAHVDLSRCADCGACLKSCEDSALTLEFIGRARQVRKLLGLSLEASQNSARPTI
jgi:uncharacterized protein (DUF362 family)/Pyruvate/2-oxoacid:ferredoxin oxidoreductase delta subunit